MDRAQPPQPSNSALNGRHFSFEQSHDHAAVQDEIRKFFHGIKPEDARFWISCGQLTKNADEVALAQRTSFVRRSLLGWADWDELETESDIVVGKYLFSMCCMSSPLFSISNIV
jgi:hypothetical protein